MHQSLPEPKHFATMRTLEALWRSKLAGRTMPRRSDLPVEELRDWMGRLAIVEVIRGEPIRFRLRLVGTGIVDYDGRDYTGRFLDEVLVAAIREKILDQYRECVATRKPCMFHYASIDPRGLPVLIEKLFLPFSDGGAEVEQILVYIDAEFARSRDGQSTLQTAETSPQARGA